MRSILVVAIIYCFSLHNTYGQKYYSLQEINSAYEQLKNEDPDSARLVIRLGRELMRDQEDFVVANYYMNLSDHFYTEREIDSSIYYTNKAHQLFVQLNNSRGLVISLADLGLYAYHKNQFVKAQEYYQEALKLAESNGLSEERLMVLSRIGFLYTLEERFDEAYNYALLAFQGRRHELTPDLVKATFNLANLLKRMSRYEEALVYLDTMEQQTIALDFEYGRAKGLVMKAYVLIELSRFDEATETLDQARIIYEKLQIPFEMFQLEMAQGQIEQEREDYVAMDKQMKRVEQWLFAAEQDNELLYEYYDALYHCNKGLGRTNQALAALESKSILRDSIFNTTSASQRDELIEKYESEKKDQEIANLAQQATIQSLQIQTRNYQLLGFGVVGLMLAGFGFMFYKQKSAMQQQRVADVEQKLLRLQMNPHFFFNALAVIQGLMEQKQADKASMFLARFSRLMRQTLEYSREEFISLEEEQELLENYIRLQILSTGIEFRFKIKIDDELDAFETMVPPMIAQPFVENAIIHAGLGEIPDGLLIIEFKKANDKIKMIVNDNGHGINEKKKDSGHKSLAMQITKERLDLMAQKFKTKLDLQVQSSEKGTRIELDLPLVN